MTRVIMAAIPVPGHVNPLRPIAAHLVSEGHEVIFVTGTNLREAVETTGATFHPLKGAANYDGRDLYKCFPQLALAEPGVPQIEAYIGDVLAAPMKDQHDTVQEVLAQRADTPTVVMHDLCFNGLWPVQLGAPGIKPAQVIGLGVMVLPMSSMDTAPFGVGIPPDATPSGRERNKRLNAEVQEAFKAAQETTERLVRECGGTQVPPYYFDAQVLVPDRVLQLSIPGMEYPRSDLPSSVEFVGAVVEERDDSTPLPSWWDDVLAADKVVFVSQGTVSNKDLSELLLPTIDALADQDCLVVATTGWRSVDELGPLPSNVRATEYIPYSKLLPHVDVFVCNGGFGGVQQAFGNGVPLVLAGETEEKKDSTAHSAWTGAAVNLATGKPLTTDIRRAVLTVLGDDSFRTAARRLQAEYAEYDALRAIAKIVSEFNGPVTTYPRPRHAYLFPGQDAYVPGVLAAARQRSSRVGEVLERIDRAATAAGARPVSALLTDASSLPLADLADLDPARLHLAVFATEVAAAEVLAERGERPDHLLGYGLGELAALTVAGAADLETGVALVCRRDAALQASVSDPGGMIAVGGRAEVVRGLVTALDDRSLVLAADDGPEQVVVSGPAAALERVVSACSAVGLPTTRLPVRYSLQNPVLRAAADRFTALMDDLSLNAPAVPVYSPLLGREVLTVADVVEACRVNLVGPIGFHDATIALRKLGISRFTECGAKSGLVDLVAANLAGIEIAAPLRTCEPVPAVRAASPDAGAANSSTVAV
jgi:MGT family glycosyltransferase